MGIPDGESWHVRALAFEPGEAFQFDWSEGQSLAMSAPSAYEVELQPCRRRPGASPAGARDAVRCPKSCVPRLRLAAASTTICARRSMVGRGKERDVSVRFMAMVTCSSQSSAIRRPAGRRSRRTCRMRAIGSFSCSHAFRHSKP